jgi:hypothetical protein
LDISSLKVKTFGLIPALLAEKRDEKSVIEPPEKHQLDM